jgi:hypothetical protein
MAISVGTFLLPAAANAGDAVVVLLIYDSMVVGAGIGTAAAAAGVSGNSNISVGLITSAWFSGKLLGFSGGLVGIGVWVLFDW